MSLDADLRAALDPAALFAAATGQTPLPWQSDYLRERGDIALLKARQIGASTAAAVKCIHVALFEDDSTSVVISPTLKQSSEILIKARAAFRTLGIPLRTDSASVLGLRNGSRIVSLPGSARSVRGYSAHLLVVDEGAFVEADVFAAARPLTIATHGQTVLQSTPSVAAGDFHAAVTGDDPSWRRFVVPATDVSTIDPDWLERERRSLPPDIFASEYECQFLDFGATLFDADRIASLVLEEDV